MPFITSEARRMTDTLGPKEVGDRCFMFYRAMLRAWRAFPRWTTAHELYKDMVMIPSGLDNPNLTTTVAEKMDDRAARELAWQVFFNLHVLPYELQKRTLNGEIDY